MSAKEDTATGIISVAIFGFSGQFSPADMSAWADVVMRAAPVVLILFLIWRMHKLDKQHSDCMVNWQKSQDQQLLMYRAIQDPSICKGLPPEHEFVANSFCLSNHQAKDK